jgi:alpha-ketoglutarate-dependent taurine dioxygenase
MAMQTRPIAPGLTFGAVVTGADLARLAPAEWSTIERTFVERGVLVFKDQVRPPASPPAGKHGHCDITISQYQIYPIRFRG